MLEKYKAIYNQLLKLDFNIEKIAWKDTKKVLREFYKEYQSLDQERQKEYLEFKQLFDAYYFRYFDEKEILDYFHKGIEFLLKKHKIDYILDSLRFYLIDYWYAEEYKEMKEKLLENLYENKEILTKQKIIYERGEEVIGNVHNWFLDYQIHSVDNRDVRIDMVEYFNNSPSIKRLDSDDKEAVKTLVYLIEYLKATDETILAQEEDVVLQLSDSEYAVKINGNVYVIKSDPEEEKNREILLKLYEDISFNKEEVKAQNISKQNTTEETLKNIKDQNTEHLQMAEQKLKTLIQKKLTLTEKEKLEYITVLRKFKKLADDDLENYFWEAYQNFNLYMLVASLQEYIERAKIEELLGNNRLRLLLNDFKIKAVKKYQNLDNNLKLLLIYLFEEHLNIDLNDARKWELYLLNLYAKKYNKNEYRKLLALNKKTERLEWVN